MRISSLFYRRKELVGLIPYQEAEMAAPPSLIQALVTAVAPLANT